MDIVKPAPIQLGGRYLYTLSSYDPVELEVYVPSVTDDDVELAIEALARENGAEPAEVDDAWVAEHIDGADSVESMRSLVRSQLGEMNSYMAEREKAERCAAKLAERLGQSVPDDEVARVAAAMMSSIQQDLADSGMDISALAAQGGPSISQLEAMVAADAKGVAERDAALSAFASERKLAVDETEYPALLGLPPKGAAELIEDARKAGQSESLRQAALNAKAMRIVVDECRCSYMHETPEQAQVRIAKMRELRAKADGGSDIPEGGIDPELKLV